MDQIVICKIVNNSNLEEETKGGYQNFGGVDQDDYATGGMGRNDEDDPYHNDEQTY
jgi:hypothetical protein